MKTSNKYQMLLGNVTSYCTEYVLPYYYNQRYYNNLAYLMLSLATATKRKRQLIAHCLAMLSASLSTAHGHVCRDAADRWQ